ncbi:hypothetical protein EVJ50_02645 [Synechococcus sp. RSCCF101]|uniref:PAS domain-containing protein n=1 Tax=Synechococcus sp. RSCCF101 TaxID=2511069 RepID=UPI0012450621|nr:PAS domain-containing protein [Synechococcus sp. RSCCF101]QEY31308.1 hypothetical protein EVJ50_02645 [Synechococcus sp. RSCCF101]
MSLLAPERPEPEASGEEGVVRPDPAGVTHPQLPSERAGARGSPAEAFEQAREAQLYLDQAARLASIGFWRWDVVTNAVTWSDQVYRNYGFEIGSPVTYERIVARLHPDDVERHHALTSQWLMGGPFDPFDYRIVLDDGSVRTIRAHGALFSDAEGRPLTLYGATQDITRERALEDAQIAALSRTYEVYRATVWAAEHIINTLLNQLLVVEREMVRHPDFNPEARRAFLEARQQACHLLDQLSHVPQVVPELIERAVQPVAPETEPEPEAGFEPLPEKEPRQKPATIRL